MSIAEICDVIADINDPTDRDHLCKVAAQCEAHLGNVDIIVETVVNTLHTADGPQRLALWLFIDRLAKQHTMFLDAFRGRIISLATASAPRPGSAEWKDFEVVLRSSFAVLFGEALVMLLLFELDPSNQSRQAAGSARARRGDAAEKSAQEKTTADETSAAGAKGEGEGSQVNASASGTLVRHQAALRTQGAFVTKTVNFERAEADKHKLLVKTLDSQMAMSVSSSYAPAKPMEVAVPILRPDADAPRGYMQAVSEEHKREYTNTRRKRLRDIMERNRLEQDRRQEEEQLSRVRLGARGSNSSGGAGAGSTNDAGYVIPDYSDIVMPAELPRDEYGVKRANFPLGVKFIRDAIRSCGGAIELEVVVRTISTMANKEVVGEFGDVREFLLIHKPTFRVENERGKWIVRLTENRDGADDATWERMSCPLCSKVLKGRNLARHINCRRCITTQIALGLQGNVRGPIAELAFTAKNIIERREVFDDFDLETFADCIERAAEVRRLRLSSTVRFAPVMKAMRVIRDRWLERKHVSEVEHAVVDAGDAAVAAVFRAFGSNAHRLPVPWIDMGDVIDMCHRFTVHVKPPYNPPPRPADPRTSLNNEYPGFLFCESEIDSEDDASGNEDEFSDDEAPTFSFAPPVALAESLFTAGFERDTKRLQHRMRTAPPMVLQRVLSSDQPQTQQAMYKQMASDSNALRNLPNSATAAAAVAAVSSNDRDEVRRF